MKIRFLALVLCSLIASLARPAQAQVPGVVNYQGRIVVGSTNFNGTGQFKFALTNGNGSSYYWLNDGTVVGPPFQPNNAVSLTVTNGLYSVLLGDTTLANMTTVPASVFTNSDVRLRVWFNDGTHGFQLLTPDQRLAASGYALMAGGVDLPVTTSATSGVLQIAGSQFLHAYGPGGLPDGNTFVGYNSGNFTLTGVANTALGDATLPVNSTGRNNTAAGYAALNHNTAGSDNTVSGVSAMASNTTAGQNVAIGAQTLAAQNYNNGGTSWNSNNVAVGYQALAQDSPNTTTNGINNTAVGTAALHDNTTGSSNIALGHSAGSNLNTGSNNIYIGDYNSNTQTSSDMAGESNIIRIGDGATQTDTYLTGIIHGNGSGLTGLVIPTSTTFSGDINLPATTSASTGVLEIGGTSVLQAYGAGGLTSGNIFVGSGSGNFSLTGTYNSANGYQALSNLTSGTANTATGYQALLGDASGNLNTADGYLALTNNNGFNNAALGAYGLGQNTTGNNNTGVGSGSLGLNTVGNDNVAAGFNALYDNTTAAENVAVGSGALFTQSFFNGGTAWNSNNVAVGYQALYSNQPTSTGNGVRNTAVGTNALHANTTGVDNTASGFSSLAANTTGAGNTASGQGSLSANTTGSNNTATGISAMAFNTTGSDNVALGNTALSKNTSGGSNVAIGESALFANTTAGQNVALGLGALFSQSFSNGGAAWNSQNVAVGYQALSNNQPTSTGNGIQNTAVGGNALTANTTGGANTASGYSALNANTTGFFNVASGYAALASNTTGNSNIAIGNGAGFALTTGSHNIDIGSAGVAGESNIIRIGDGSTQTDTYLTGSVHATTVGIGITASHGTLDVSGDTGSYSLGSTNAGFNGTSSGITHFNPGSPASAIYANGGIVTTESFIAVSDARVKLVLGRSDAARDLDTLRAIAVTDFRYKDVIAHGEGVHKKVIAQELEQVFPQAVSQRTGEVPDIYQRATIGADGWIELATDLKIGERVKLIGEQSQGVYNVNAVAATRFRTDFQPAANAVIFVYGREVQDFRAVDYEAIAMLNVSATQELGRQLTAADQEKAALKKRVTDLEARLAKLEQQIK